MSVIETIRYPNPTGHSSWVGPQGRQSSPSQVFKAAAYPKLRNRDLRLSQKYMFVMFSELGGVGDDGDAFANNLGAPRNDTESGDKVDVMEEVKNEENAIVVAKTKEKSIQEEKNRENAIAEEEKNEEIAIVENVTNEEVAMEEEEANENQTEEQNEEKVEAGSKEVRKPRKRGRRKVMAHGGSKTVATTEKHKSESSGKNKASKKVETMGMVFMCSSKTKKDCYRYKVLGLPESKRDLVQRVYKGMRLFLFDVDLRLMYGIYKAAGPGGYNIEPKAFASAFPSQVRFTVLEDCLPLAEEKFKKIIKDNYYSRNKFDCLLKSEQVKELCRLFVAASKRPKSKQVGRSVRAERHTSVDRGKTRRRFLDKERRSGFGGEWRYHERPVIDRREVFASPMAPLPRVPPLPPSVHSRSYACERALEMDAYGRDPLLEHRGLRILDLEQRRRDEIGRRGPYISYGERGPPPYLDPVYSVGLPPDYHPPAALPPEYRSLGQRTEYQSSAGVPPEYHPPAGSPPNYDYREYHPLRPSHRY